MQATIGNHKGTPMEILVLKRPDYINWLLHYNAKGPLEVMKMEVIRLLEIFDAKPFVSSCSSLACPLPAFRATVYGEDVTPMCWCADCDPHKLGAQPGKIQIIRTYQEALLHVKLKCHGARASYLKIISNLARIKGLGLRVGTLQAEIFFSKASEAE